MSVSIVGFDLGSLTSYVVVARQGGLESVANEYSDRNTPTCVSFNDKMRFIGHEAKQQQISNIKNTVCGFNGFVGKTFNDAMVMKESERQLCKIMEVDDQRVGFEVNYLGEKQLFSAEQLYAMQLTKMKEVAEMNLNTKVVDVVINVPTNSTDSERRAVLDAAKIANLNCLRIINDTTSSALAYGFYQKDLPEDKPNTVVFVDMGYSNLQTALVAFNKGKMSVIASACDNIGGRDFDQAIYDHVKDDFRQRYKLTIEDDKKPGVRLMQECEKLKKLMSANSTPIPLNIECFMNDVDVSTKMQRSELEALASPVLIRLRSTLERLLKEAGMTSDQIDSVEVVGGSTRVSAVKEIISSVFKQQIHTSLNADEAVARGCAIQCAILSPSLRSKEFTIIDSYPYPIELKYNVKDGIEQIEVFPKWSTFPSSKQMTFNRGASFGLEAAYGDCKEMPISNLNIGMFNVTGVTPAPDTEVVKVKVKLRLNANGIFTCCQAQQIDKPIEIDVADLQNAVENMENVAVKKATKTVDLPMQAMLHQYMPTKIASLNEIENQMIVQVKLEKEKAQAKNAVEEYVYDMKDKLCGELEAFVNETELNAFMSELTAAENWIYEDGDDVAKEVYNEKLAHLRATGDIIMKRAPASLEQAEDTNETE